MINMIRCRRAACYLFAVMAIAPVSAQKSGYPSPVVSLHTLLLEMASHEALTRYPAPAFSLQQSSSWDRSERNMHDSASWFGNKDMDNYLSTDSSHGFKEYVILDAKGPGAITRWWFPQEQTLRNRNVRIYIDDNPVPVIHENYEKLLNGSSFVKWPFAFTSSDEKDAKNQIGLPPGFKQMGGDFYLPIPFSKSCRVTLDSNVFYYAIDYRMYEPGTKVISFSKQQFTRDSNLIAAIGKKLLTGKSTADAQYTKRARLEKDAFVSIDLPEGSHAVGLIEVNIHAAENKQKNRSAVLEMVADGKQTIWVPVSEFFGGGPYARAVKNYAMAVDPGGQMICHWMMPYRHHAKIILHNFGTAPLDASLGVQVRDYHWDDHTLYFHASWHEQAPLPVPPSMDWNYIDIKGKGLYVGDVLTVYSAPKIWWGEGDEKIYIDEDTFPTHLGTGMEDYYGYAWGLAHHFSSPFISMPLRDARGKADWSGYNTTERMRLLDDIPFRHSLKVDMEALLFKRGVSFSVACFWYGTLDAESNVQPDIRAVTRTLPDKP